MRRHTFVIGYCLFSSTTLLVYFWSIGRCIGNGFDRYFPAKNRGSYSIAAVLFVVGVLWERVASPPRPLSQGGVGRIMARVLFSGFSCVGMVAAIRLSIPAVAHLFGADWRLSFQQTIGWLGALDCSYIGYRILPAVIRNPVPMADDVLKVDKRKPIVYLRSFEKERKKASIFRGFEILRHPLQAAGGFYGLAPGSYKTYNSRLQVMNAVKSERRHGFDEQMLVADAMNSIGPYIALGRPNERFRDMDLGASKKYVADENWRDELLRWLSSCAAVVIEVAVTHELPWEIEQVVLRVPPTVILLLCPFTDKPYQQFVQAYGDLFPKGLPIQRPESRLLVFDAEWNFKSLERVNLSLRESLEPFFECIRESKMRTWRPKLSTSVASPSLPASDPA